MECEGVQIKCEGCANVGILFFNTGNKHHCADLHRPFPGESWIFLNTLVYYLQVLRLYNIYI